MADTHAPNIFNGDYASRRKELLKLVKQLRAMGYVCSNFAPWAK